MRRKFSTWVGGVSGETSGGRGGMVDGDWEGEVRSFASR